VRARELGVAVAAGPLYEVAEAANNLSETYTCQQSTGIYHAIGSAVEVVVVSASISAACLGWCWRGDLALT